VYPAISGIFHAKILRAIQLAVTDYMNQVATNLNAGVMGVEMPSFAAMMKDLRQGTFPQSTNWVSIPETYLLDSMNLPSTGAVGAISVTGATSTTQVSSRSGVSSLTAPTATTEHAAPT
jgi:hypothetical protein